MPPIIVGPALVYADGTVTVFETLQQMAASIVVEDLHTKRVPMVSPVPGIIDLPTPMWYELQALCAQALYGP
jgi:hypothetical protein